MPRPSLIAWICTCIEVGHKTRRRGAGMGVWGGDPFQNKGPKPFWLIRYHSVPSTLNNLLRCGHSHLSMRKMVSTGFSGFFLGRCWSDGQQIDFCRWFEICQLGRFFANTTRSRNVLIHCESFTTPKIYQIIKFQTEISKTFFKFWHNKNILKTKPQRIE